MTGFSLPAIILTVLFAVIAISIIVNWRKKAALKPNLAAVRHEREADILEEQDMGQK